MSTDNSTRSSGAKEVLRLLEQSGADLFRDLQGRAGVTFELRGRQRTVLVDSKEFRQALSSFSFEQLKSPLATPDCEVVVDTLVEKAQAMPQQEIFVRVGHAGNKIVLDLCRSDGMVVVVEPTKWTTTTKCDTKFRQPKGMLALPLPDANHADLRAELEPFFPSTSGSLALHCAHLVGALNPCVPQPVLEITGPQGSAKSTRAKAIRRIIDPAFAPIRRPPRSERDLFIAASNVWLLCLENVSTLSPWISDACCAIATGGGYATRKLYADEDEALFDVRRALILNGINQVISRADLRDRAITIRLEEIAASGRRTEREFWSTFGQSVPRILGAVLDCVATGLLLQNCVRPARLPRLADWYQFVLAAAEEQAFGFRPDEFEAAFAANREEARDLSVDMSAVGRELLSFVQDRGPWTGTLTDVLQDLNYRVSDAQQRAPEWPKSPEGLRHAIERIAPDLKASGLAITFARSNDKARSRIVRLNFTSGAAQSEQAASDSSDSSDGFLPFLAGKNKVKESKYASELSEPSELSGERHGHMRNDRQRTVETELTVIEDEVSEDERHAQVDTKEDGGSTPPVGGLTMNINSDAMPERLTAIVHETIIDLLDLYHRATADRVAEEVCFAHPDLKEIVGKEGVAHIADVMLDTPWLNIESGKYTALYTQLNREYFGERLPQFVVRVVYDPMDSDFRIDRGGRTMNLRMARYYDDYMLHRLIQAMALVATNDEDGAEWQREMIRLQDVGAPVPEWVLSECKLEIIEEAGLRIAVPVRSAQIHPIPQRV